MNRPMVFYKWILFLQSFCLGLLGLITFYGLTQPYSGVGVNVVMGGVFLLSGVFFFLRFRFFGMSDFSNRSFRPYFTLDLLLQVFILFVFAMAVFGAGYRVFGEHFSVFG